MDHVELTLNASPMSDKIRGARTEFEFESYGVVFRNPEPSSDGVHTRIIPWGVIQEVRISTTQG